MAADKNPKEEKTRTGKNTIVQKMQYLMVELFIVFIGVYLAFQLNDYRSERETNQRRHQIQEALGQEINIFILGADQTYPYLESLYQDWRTKYEAGEKPVPLYFQIGGVDLPPRGMWQSVMASEGVTTLPVETLQKLSDYYNALDILLDKYAEISAFSELEIIPVEEPETFYHAEGGNLKRKYVAYMQRMQDMLNLFEVVRGKAEQSRESLTLSTE